MPPIPSRPRYTPGRYRDCRFCDGRGCPACDDEAEKAYKQEFPDGPKPIATVSRDDPQGAAKLAAAIVAAGGVVVEQDQLIETLESLFHTEQVPHVKD